MARGSGATYSLRNKLNEEEEEKQLAEFRKQMNFPKEVTRSRVVDSGTPREEEDTKSSKGRSYDRGGKRDTRLVRKV